MYQSALDITSRTGSLSWGLFSKLQAAGAGPCPSLPVGLTCRPLEEQSPGTSPSPTLAAPRNHSQPPQGSEEKQEVREAWLLYYGVERTLTRSQDLDFPRVLGQDPLVCPPECHASCQAEKRGGHPHSSQGFKTSLAPLPTFPFAFVLNEGGPERDVFTEVVLDHRVRKGRLRTATDFPR